MRTARIGVVLAAAISGVVIGAAPAMADCSSSCAAGSAGVGGVSSGGAAQGFRTVGPSPNPAYPNTTVVNEGGPNSGHLSVSGDVSGSGSGAYTPQGVVVGHYDG